MNVPLAATISLAALLLAEPMGKAAAWLATPPPETPEAFLLRMKPIFDHDAFVSKTDDELGGILIPKIEVHETTLQEVVDQLNKVILTHNSKPGAFQIPLLRLHVEHVPAQPGGPSIGSNTNPTPYAKIVAPYAAPIGLSLSNTNLKALIRYVTSLCGMVINIEPDAIWVKPLSQGMSVLIKRVYVIPDAVCTTKAEVEKLLKPNVPQFDSPDCFWNFDERSHLLTLQFANSAIEEFEKDYARELIRHGFRAPSSASPH